MKNVIFDLDGTLLNTLDDLYLSVNHTLEKFNKPLRTKDEVRKMLGNGMRFLIHSAMPENDYSQEKDAFEAFISYYMDHSMDNTLPYDGIMEMLSNCCERGLHCAIVSNKAHSAVLQLNERFFHPYMKVVMGEHKPFRRKPYPDMIKEVMRLMNASVDDTVYVGDSEVDLLTAQNSNLSCLSVSWGFRSRSFLENLGARMIIDSPDEIPLLMGQN